MSAFHDDIRNLSAVLDSLHSGAYASQLPVLHLVIDHLRLMVRLMDQDCPEHLRPQTRTPPASPATSTPSAFMCACHSGEARYDQ